MAKIYRDNMGDLHIWKNDDCKLQRRGLHHSASVCDGKEADVFIQFDADLFMKEHFTEEQIDDLTNGFPVTADLGI